MLLKLRNVEGEKKIVCSFFLLENSRPLSLLQESLFSSLGTVGFLSTCLGIDFLIPPFSFRRIMLLRERGIFFVL